MGAGRFSSVLQALPCSVWILIGMILSGVCCARAQDRADGGSGSSGQMIVTQRAIRHIQERHWPDSDAPGAGKFADGITVRDLRDLIDEAVAKGRVRVNSHGRPGVVFEYDFGRPIGVNIQGEPASRLRVVVAPDHTVITAFPF